MVRHPSPRLIALSLLIGIVIACGGSSDDSAAESPESTIATAQPTATGVPAANTPNPPASTVPPATDPASAPISPPDPVVGSLNPPGNALAVTVRDGLAYVANGLEGIRIVDISDPTAIVDVGALNTQGNAFDISISGDVAYIADGVGGLQIIDISDPAAPSLHAELATPGDAFGIYHSDGVVYVADGTSGVLIVDVADPTAPAVLGTIEAVGDGLGVVVLDGLAYIAGSEGGLHIVDVADPAAPVELSTFGGSNFPVLDVFVSDGIAYMTSAFLGLHIADVSDPANPVELGAIESLDIVQIPDLYQFLAISIAVEDGLAYVVGGLNTEMTTFESMLRIFDVSNAANPTEIGAWRGPPFPALGLALDGGLVYTAAGSSGMLIVDPEVLISTGLTQPNFELP